MSLLVALGTVVYAACVDFMLHLALLLGVTYRDTNAIILIVGMPLTTGILAAVAILQRVQLARLRRTGAGG